MSLQDFVEDYIYIDHGSFFPVVDSFGHLVGCIGIEQLKGTSRKEWPDLIVRDVMIPAEENSVQSDVSAYFALEKMQKAGQNRLIVRSEGGNLLGVVALETLLKVVSVESTGDTSSHKKAA